MKRSQLHAPTSLWCLTMALGLTAMISHPAAGQRFRLPFGKQAAATSDSLELNQKAGPWLVMCASFDGIDGQQQAIRLAQELRERHQLKSYIYERQFDYRTAVSDKGLGYQKPVEGGQENVRPREMKLANGNSKQEFAVLVGDFPAIDDARAQRTLEIIKQLAPESMNQFSQDIEDSALAGARMRAMSDALYGNQGDSTWTSMKHNGADSKQPLRAAFLLTNPALPEEYFEDKQIDHYVLGLNKGLDFSLLNNPHQYSIKIASFAGKTTVNLEEINRRQEDSAWLRRNQSGRNNDSLVECAKKAAILTKYLRNKGIDAYEFHDRHESYVCVGGFDWITQEQNGSMYTNPEVNKVVNTFRGREAGSGRVLAGYALPGKLISAGITCDSNPIPIIVPNETPHEASRRGMFR